MRITVSTEGGIANFPGLQRPVSFSVDELPSAQQSELRSLIDQCDFFNLPAHPERPAAGAADYRTYVITVETPERTHTLTVHEPVKDERLRRLVQLVRSMRLTR
jgi:hypothetical protein